MPSVKVQVFLLHLVPAIQARSEGQRDPVLDRGQLPPIQPWEGTDLVCVGVCVCARARMLTLGQCYM